MSQYHFVLPVYEATEFGHPHELAEPQNTEPFWHQYPSWTELGAHSYYHHPAAPNNYNFYKMDPPTIVIGSNSRYGRGVQAQGGQQGRNDKPKAQGKVGALSDGVYLQQVSLRLLVRFSSVAQRAFPKPMKAVEMSKKVTGIAEVENSKKPVKKPDWVEDSEQNIGVEELAAEMTGTKLADSPKPEETAAPNGHRQGKTLDLKLNDAWAQPPVEAFGFAFKWMAEAQRTSGPGSRVLEYGVTHPDKLPLNQLVDVYAAALALELRPPPFKLRATLYTRVSEHPPSRANLQHIHEHLPLHEGVVTRAITSFVQNRGPKAGKYSKAERDDVEDYLYSVDEKLFNRYMEIVQHREQIKQSNNRERAAAKLQKLAEGGGKETNTEKVVTEGKVATDDPTPAEAAKEDNGNGGGRRHDRGKVMGNGRGVGGKHALGAN